MNKAKTTRILKGRKALLWPILVCLLLVLPATIHVFERPLFVGHDYTHAVRLVEMVSTLQSEQIPPRWSQHLGFGYGMPIFSFYAPLPYLVGSVLILLGLSVTTTIQLLFFIALFGAGVTMFYLSKTISSRNEVAVLAAAMFIYLPYRAVDVYVRGALGELWGIWLLALVILCLRRFFAQPTYSRVVAYVVSLGLFLLSHNLMVLMGAPVIAAVILFHLAINQQPLGRTLKLLFLGSLWGIGLAAFFILPMTLEKQYTAVAALTQIDGGYAKHFVYWKQLFHDEFAYGGSIEGIMDGMSFELGKAGWLTLLAATILSLYYVYQRRLRHSAQLLFWLCLTGVALFLTSSKSQGIWNNVSQMAYIQFPWRWLSISLISLPILFTYLMQARLHRRARQLLMLVIATLLLIEVRHFVPNQEIEERGKATETSTSFIQTEMSKTIPDYIHPSLAAVIYDSSLTLTPPESAFTTKPSAPITMQEANAHTLQVIVPPLDEQLVLTANRFDFPGWQWQVDGKTLAHQTNEDLPTMQISLEAAKTPRTISVQWNETPLRRLANGLSLVAWLLVGLYGAQQLKKSHFVRRKPEAL